MKKKKNQVQKLLLAKGHQNLSSSCVISGQCRTTISSSSGLSCLLTITVLKEREMGRNCKNSLSFCHIISRLDMAFFNMEGPLTLER